MKFHYEFDIKKLPEPITHRQKIMLVGSCFTENIGAKLRSHKFSVLENPHGILFNPISVAESLTDYIEKRQYTENDLFCLNEGWHSWKHHSRFSSLDPLETLERINQSVHNANLFLKDCEYLMITLGSSWVYTLTDEALNGNRGVVAANNHKAPSSWFSRKLLSTEEVLGALDNVIHRLFLFNPRLKIIFTISPVRHLREGVIENNRSKAILIQAVHQLVDKFDKLYYFPAYELVIDDLRDYRFYAEDLVHPNYFATRYVWEKFVSSCVSEASQKLMEEIAAVNQAMNHKAFNPGSAQHKKFLQSFYEKTMDLKAKNPYLDFEKEFEFFKL